MGARGEVDGSSGGNPDGWPVGRCGSAPLFLAAGFLVFVGGLWVSCKSLQEKSRTHADAA
jgi:hypothetical protein